MKSEKGLELTMNLSKNREKYDANAKRLFGRKEILAPILKEVVSEYNNCTTEEIMDLIEGDTVKLGTLAVSPDMSSTIMGENTESIVEGEATSRFDVAFRSLLPGRNGTVGINLHIDLEIQGDGKPGYPIINRGIYYACRKLSMQLQKVDDKDVGYRALEKVYSIWICIDRIPKCEQNSIAFYKIENYRNINIDPKEKGDLLEIVIIRLGNPEDSPNDVLDMLNAIFNGDKETVMNYIPQSDNDNMEEVKDMLSIIDVIEERAIRKGRKEGLKNYIELCQEIGDTKEKIILRVSEKFKLSVDEAEEYVEEYLK